MATAVDEARRLFRRHGGILRTRDALAAGIHPRTLYAMNESGETETLSRGVHRLASLSSLADPDLTAVAMRVPNAVVCLISALSLHGLTTQIPHEVHIAIPRTARTPALDHPPIRVFRFGNASLRAGVEEREIDTVVVKIYSAEKTLADCFQYRNRIGLDVAIEALRMYRERRKRDFEAVLRYAKVCRVEHVMRPYLEAIQ